MTKNLRYEFSLWTLMKWNIGMILGLCISTVLTILFLLQVQEMYYLIISMIQMRSGVSLQIVMQSLICILILTTLISTLSMLYVAIRESLVMLRYYRRTTTKDRAMGLSMTNLMEQIKTTKM